MTDLDEHELVVRVARAAAQYRDGATVSELRRLPGGKSSLTFSALLSAADGDPERIVLKVAPPGLAPVRNRDVLRQARVLRAIERVQGVRAPQVLFEDAGTPPLFGMSFVAGESYEPLTDAIARPPQAEVVTLRARAAARMLARMQAVKAEEVGLGQEPAMSLEEELDRWARLLATCGEELRGRESDLCEALADRIPGPVAPRIVHGDYRLANMQFAGERLAAIIDWEIWSIGDPRTDLAWLLMHSDPAHRFVQERDEANVRAGEGMPDCGALLAEYDAEAAATHAAALAPGPAMAAPHAPSPALEAEDRELDWFLAYAHYKCASTIAALTKHSRRRPDRDGALEVAAATLPAMVDRGLALLSAGISSRG